MVKDLRGRHASVLVQIGGTGPLESVAQYPGGPVSSDVHCKPKTIWYRWKFVDAKVLAASFRHRENPVVVGLRHLKVRCEEYIHALAKHESAQYFRHDNVKGVRAVFYVRELCLPESGIYLCAYLLRGPVLFAVE